MDNVEPIPAPGPAEQAPVFGGFPYLVTRMVASLHHILLLPRCWGIDRLAAFAMKQAAANRLPTCLVLAGDHCVYLQEDGSGYPSHDIPSGANVSSERLAPAEPLPESTDMAIRRMRLVLFEEVQHEGPGTKILTGDLLKGGRLPTPEEKELLAGTHAGGVPKGLLPCLQCGDWRGECFDTLCRELVVRVHCTCENDNRCARCGGLLFDRKLNANYFDPANGKIWHMPGFCAFDHRCKDLGIGYSTSKQTED